MIKIRVVSLINDSALSPNLVVYSAVDDVWGPIDAGAFIKWGHCR